MGGGIPLSVLHTQSDAAANYSCPVGTHHVRRSTVAVDGVLDPQCKGGGPGPRPLFSPWSYSRAERGCCCFISILLLLLGGGVGKEEQGASWKQMGWGKAMD